MLPEEIREQFVKEIAQVENPREKAIDVMYAIQRNFGYMSDEAMIEAAELLSMSPVELEEIATFYNFILREPAGRHVIRVCDSAMCWLDGYQSILDYLRSRLKVEMGGTTDDGLFTLLPVCCIGYCDRAPAMMINRTVYGYLTTEKIDRILQTLVDQSKTSISD
ncbi:MAG: NADH-quinone oxidoreductase subunit NuoE [Desulfoferrobacter sp.]